jgi:thiamine phosphate synthase YjbQ (UPF0047 family)
MLRQAQHALRVRAPEPGLHEITEEVSGRLESQQSGTGLLTLFCPHTAASLIVQEYAARAARHEPPLRRVVLHLIGEAR